MAGLCVLAVGAGGHSLPPSVLWTMASGRVPGPWCLCIRLFPGPSPWGSPCQPPGHASSAVVTASGAVPSPQHGTHPFLGFPVCTFSIFHTLAPTVTPLLCPRATCCASTSWGPQGLHTLFSCSGHSVSESYGPCGPHSCDPESSLPPSASRGGTLGWVPSGSEWQGWESVSGLIRICHRHLGPSGNEALFKARCGIPQEASAGQTDRDVGCQTE